MDKDKVNKVIKVIKGYDTNGIPYNFLPCLIKRIDFEKYHDIMKVQINEAFGSSGKKTDCQITVFFSCT